MELRGRKRLNEIVARAVLAALLVASGCSLPRYEDYAGVRAKGGGNASSGAGGSVAGQGFGQAGTNAQAGHGGDPNSDDAGMPPDSGMSGEAGASESGGSAGLVGAGASVGFGGGGGGAAGSSACVPNSSDTVCDGLDANCKPTSSETACPTGCKGVRYNAKSYMGCAVSATFSDAEILCQEQGMDLVQVDDASENNFVLQLAQTLGSYVWLGGSDLEQLGTFSWVNATAFYKNGPVGQVYQNFDTGEPISNAGRDCVQIHDSVPGPWSAAHCSSPMQFICEQP